MSVKHEPRVTVGHEPRDPWTTSPVARLLPTSLVHGLWLVHGPCTVSCSVGSYIRSPNVLYVESCNVCGRAGCIEQCQCCNLYA